MQSLGQLPYRPVFPTLEGLIPSVAGIDVFPVPWYLLMMMLMLMMLAPLYVEVPSSLLVQLLVFDFGQSHALVR